MVVAFMASAEYTRRFLPTHPATRAVTARGVHTAAQCACHRTRRRAAPGVDGGGGLFELV